MRALGPGSVSSFLKVILDVVRWALMVAMGTVALAVLAALLLSFNPELLGSLVNVSALHLRGPWLGPALAATLLATDLYMAGALVIVGRLRRIFQTLIAGDPFHPDNVRRLRVIGAALAFLELGRFAFAAVARVVLHEVGIARPRVSAHVNLTAWFAVLVIVVLAEVFREGARLRGEAELTI
ncbi:MAG TPA: DUF2975 domain-containing protein [Caulobacteraceae bacterium]|nr:DUF2975 domain-containing protein [Caulobacteraceae bacterium]